MVNITKYGKFDKFEKNKNKKQIIICHTYRSVNNYLNSLKFRKNGKFEKIPNFVITKEGRILKLIPEDGYTSFFSDKGINKNSIIICLENLGWLNKMTLSNKYSNWINETTSNEVFTKKWRDKHYWDIYNQEQIDSLVELCKKILKKYSINKSFIGHNTKVDGIKIFNGIVCRSNYENKYTDVSPAFNFEYFKNQIEND
jgi:N-acetyl-anhydromuramyl-L-alanine amidase AmpD